MSLLRIVGIAQDIREDGIKDGDPPQMYLPYAQNPSSIVHLLARTQGPPLDWATAVRRAVADVDRDEPVFDVKTLERITEQSFARQGTFGAARRATPERIQNLELLHLNSTRAASASNCQAYVCADLLWRGAVWQTTENEALPGARLVLPLFGFSAILVPERPGFDLRQDAYSHVPLLEGIRQRDPLATRRAFDTAFETWSSRHVLAESEIETKESKQTAKPASRRYVNKNRRSRKTRTKDSRKQALEDSAEIGR